MIIVAASLLIFATIFDCVVLALLIFCVLVIDKVALLVEIMRYHCTKIFN